MPMCVSAKWSMRIGSVIGRLAFRRWGSVLPARRGAFANGLENGVVQVAVGDYDAPVARHAPPGAEIQIPPINVGDPPARLSDDRVSGAVIPHLFQIPIVRRETNEDVAHPGGDHGVLVLAVELMLRGIGAAPQRLPDPRKEGTVGEIGRAHV